MPTPDHHTPRTVTELRRTCNAARATENRTVTVISYPRLPPGPTSRVDVRGPAPHTGATLTLYLRTGLTHLRVLSGRVHVIADSTWGNAVTIAPDAAATTTVHVPTPYPADGRGRARATKVTLYGPLPDANLTGDTRRTRRYDRDHADDPRPPEPPAGHPDRAPF
jgi:hypothetical protein